MRGKDSGLQRTPAACVKAPAGKIASGRGRVARSQRAQDGPTRQPPQDGRTKDSRTPGRSVPQTQLRVLINVAAFDSTVFELIERKLMSRALGSLWECTHASEQQRSLTSLRRRTFHHG